ncbi:DUF4328 domain-containing protein [Nonomuraea ferruginea]|uniref:DUF4328 domain-containing protein n=1 Tax=Nonomuraea ferruginea TaxID=46174 RepID=A0ABT4SXP0_9ACTN|nr:DUF4328 domain-containing protein [Nonomuraea ferruginea]MDA0641645.1 DUF4328 domain-containing protein [Nonomuraea ferruginea]
MYPLPLRPARGVAFLAVGALVLHSLVAVGVIVVDLQRAAFIDRVIADPAAITMEEVEASDAVYALTGMAELGVYVLTAVAFLVWIFRVRANAEILAPDEQRHSRPWAILAWFVPIISLWFPKRIVDDIWSASHRDENDPWPRSGLVTLWWALWLIGNWVALVAGRLFFNAEELESMASAARFDVLSCALMLVAAVPAALVVLRISNAQEARRPAAPVSPFESPAV